MANVLVCDQSTRCTGYGYFVSGKYVESGIIDMNKSKLDTNERSFEMAKEMWKIIKHYKPDYLVLEDIQLQNNVQNNVQTFKTLAEVFGVISELLVEMKIPQSAVLASSWKSALGIKGRARAEQKRAAQEWVVTTYGVCPTQDECDAVCIGSYKAKTKDAVEGFDWAD